MHSTLVSYSHMSRTVLSSQSTDTYMSTSTLSSQLTNTSMNTSALSSQSTKISVGTSSLSSKSTKSSVFPTHLLTSSTTKSSALHQTRATSAVKDYVSQKLCRLQWLDIFLQAKPAKERQHRSQQRKTMKLVRAYCWLKIDVEGGVIAAELKSFFFPFFHERVVNKNILPMFNI